MAVGRRRGGRGLRCWLHPNMYVFIIPRLMERKRENGTGCDDVVSWNGRERDVLEHFAA